MSDTQDAQKQAQQSYIVNPMTPMASEQAIRDAETRNAYNAELERQRRETERKQQQG